MGGAALAGGASADTEGFAPNSGYWPVVKQGETSENVRAIQWRLNCHGDKVATPSHSGPKTHAAVKSFQYKNGDKVDGVIGASTWTGKGGFSYGERSDRVKALQVALNKWRYDDDLPITGYLGPRTQKKLHRFQYGHGLPATSYADLKTWHKPVSIQPGK